MGRSFEDDPLTRALAPPPGETPEQRDARLKVEAEARRVSDRIDEQIRVEKAALRRSKKPVKVLLLGQSESGKSTTLKNFQIAYAQTAWAEERASWRTVIQLNLVRNVNTILRFLALELSSVSKRAPTGAPYLSASLRSHVLDPEGSDDETLYEDEYAGHGLVLTETHRLWTLRLAPLRTVQRDLELALGASSGEDVDPTTPTTGEFFIRSNSGWKSALRPGRHSTDARESKQSMARRLDGDATEVLASCVDDMRALWMDPVVRQMLALRGVRMETTPGFFLNDVTRIAMRDYVPSDQDIVRCRLRTLGVQEYKLHFDAGSAAGSDWCLYDVGGSRTQRAAWYPYFDDCDAVIFLVPINCFDETLAEDRKVNRLQDSFSLWKNIVSQKLLANAQMIVFLNKLDLLEQKLSGGARIADFVSSYGNRSNDVESATKYFQQHIKDVAKQYSPTRPVHVFVTSVVNTTTTAKTLGIVADNILRMHLRDANFM